MISLPSSVRVFLHAPPTDLRKGFDALCGLVTTAFGQDPTSGHLFLFVNRRRDRMKILYWDRDGLAIWYKRLENPGTFQIPTTAAKAASIEMTPTQLALILSGIDLKSARQRKRYQRTTPAAEKSISAPL
ncbi:MAG: IS66 family insertion sequence element accessory protein TnpB [Terriglobia bacterium]